MVLKHVVGAEGLFCLADQSNQFLPEIEIRFDESLHDRRKRRLVVVPGTALFRIALLDIQQRVVFELGIGTQKGLDLFVGKNRGTHIGGISGVVIWMTKR